MNIEEVRDYCLSLENSEECMPFGNDNVVFKVDGKMFVLLSLEAPFWLNVKCDPEKAIELRDHYSEVLPGYHMNKRHWNTLDLEGRLSSSFIRQQIENSYNLVRKKKR
ncbi:MmcQ/YjbR family DNA-binding protein [Bacteroidales bacterium OttesenSCG-928-B11]|nr:MmcQ/YjbR family DNA-binding protein [Bacteroidales bacterium OttesenSCG-928-C03]MDL2312741.1 MmcQ/YjbR family DNA-binding protein [Bacteroidales bacterium OttesenSCG-928-B11]